MKGLSMRYDRQMMSMRYDSTADQRECPPPHTLSFRIVAFSPFFSHCSSALQHLDFRAASPTSQSFLFFPCQRVGSKLGLTRKLPFECPQRAKWKYKCRNTRNLGEYKKSMPIVQWNIIRVHWWLTKIYYSCWWKICTDTAAMRVDIWNSQSSKMQMLKQSRFENKGFVWNFVCVKHISHLHHFHRKACFTFHHSLEWISHNNNRPLFFSIEITRTNVWPHFYQGGELITSKPLWFERPMLVHTICSVCSRICLSEPSIVMLTDKSQNSNQVHVTFWSLDFYKKRTTK